MKNRKYMKSFMCIMLISLIWWGVHIALITLYTRGINSEFLKRALAFFVVELITFLHANKICIIIACILESEVTCIILDVISIIVTLIFSTFYWFIVLFLGAEGLAVPELYYIIVAEYSLYIVVALIKLVLDVKRQLRRQSFGKI